MNASEFYSLIKQQFPHQPTNKQDVVLMQISEFIFSKTPNALYLLKGYAGTGKTTIIGTIVTNLWKAKKSAVLMAPTGRAAKVISNYSKKEAFTIHKKIYFPKKDKSGGVKFILQPNKHKNTIFIVDEASMIPDTPGESKLFENGSLLHDVVQYVSSGDQCKLIFVGDPAQLPPVHLNISPALDLEELTQFHFDKVFSIQLDAVVRQAQGSGILHNATLLRNQLNNQLYDSFKFEVSDYNDISYTNNGMDLFEAIENAFRDSGTDQTVFIVRSNKRANIYNENIRKRILGLEDDLSEGDQLMVVKNNYFWLAPESKPGFIANGDVIQIESIQMRKEIYGFSFAEVTVSLVDYPEEEFFDTVLLLKTLTSETPSLSFEDGNRLYQEVLKDFNSEKSKYKKFLKVKSNKFFNALQVKYSYAVTCHKSQGGQWENVFIEKPYLPDGPDKDYLRWLYTAMTRAKKQLFLIGFPDGDFDSIE